MFQAVAHLTRSDALTGRAAFDQASEVPIPDMARWRVRQPETFKK